MEIPIAENAITFSIYSVVETVIYVMRQQPSPLSELRFNYTVENCRFKVHKSYGRKWRNLLMKKIGMYLLAVAFCAVAFVGVSRAADEKVTFYVVD